MGRWKLGPQGGYYDANDSGPDQYTPTPAERASQGGGEQGGYAPPTGGVSGYAGGTDPRTGQPMPSPFEKFPGQGQRPPGPWMPHIYDSGQSPWSQVPWGQGGGLGTLNSIVGQPQGDPYAAFGGAPRDPTGRTLQDIFKGTSGTPPPGWKYQPSDPSKPVFALGSLGQSVMGAR